MLLNGDPSEHNRWQQPPTTYQWEHDDVIKWKHFPRYWPFVRGIPSQRPVTRSFDVFFDMHLNKRLSKQSWGWWFETLSSPLWCHSNEAITLRISRFTSGTGGCRYGNLWCQQWQQNWHHDDPPVSVWALTQEPEKRHSVCEIRKTILSVHCHMEYGFKVKWVRDPCFHLKYMWIYYLFTGCFQNGFVVSTVSLDIYIYIFIYIYIYIYIYQYRVKTG